jgi:hypothetical protein
MDAAGVDANPPTEATEEPVAKKHKTLHPFGELPPEHRFEGSRLGKLPDGVKLALSASLFDTFRALVIFCTASGLNVLHCLTNLGPVLHVYVLVEACNRAMHKKRMDVVQAVMDVLTARSINFFEASRNLRMARRSAIEHQFYSVANDGAYYSAQGALEVVVREGALPLVEAMMSHAKAVEYRPCGYQVRPLLESAAMGKHRHILEILLAQGGEFTTKTNLVQVIMGVYSWEARHVLFEAIMARDDMPVVCPENCSEQRKLLVQAAGAGATDVLRYLMVEGGIGHESNIWSSQEEVGYQKMRLRPAVILAAAKGNHVDTLEFLYQHKIVATTQVGNIVVAASSAGAADSVRFLLNQARVRASFLEKAYDEAALRDSVEVVRLWRELLLARKGVDLAGCDQAALYSAAGKGGIGVVNELLANGSVDVMAENGVVLVHAIKGGSMEVVKAVLDCPRFKPELYTHGLPTRLTLPVVQLLLKVRVLDVTPTGRHVKDALEVGRWELAKYLVQLERCDLSSSGEGLVLQAVRSGKGDLAHQLLERSSLPPVSKKEGAHAFHLAVEKGFDKLARTLLRYVFPEEIKAIAAELEGAK